MTVELATLAMSLAIAAGLATVFFVVLLVTTETRYQWLNKLALVCTTLVMTAGVVAVIISLILGVLAVAL